MPYNMHIMCGQFHINYTDVDKLNHIHILHYPVKEEIRPTEFSLVVYGENEIKIGDLFQFGIQSKYLFINIKSETIQSKFSQWILKNRCIIPVSHYYEWDSCKSKVTFSSNTLLYLAGVYHNKQFAILTTKANESVRKIHDRMPLILEEDEIEDWLWNTEKAIQLLNKTPKELLKNCQFEQLSLF